MFESNRRLAAGLVVGVAAGLAAGGVTVATGDREDQGNFTARAKVMGAPGSGISGEVRFVQRSVGGQPEPLVDVFARVEGLPPGSKRGFHVHENGTCADAGTTQFGGAGGHYDPGPQGQSTPVDNNHPYHTGDLPNLEVDHRGVGELRTRTSRFVLQPNHRTSIDDRTGGVNSGTPGAAVIVHAMEDEGGEASIPGAPGRSQYAGGSRAACGILEFDDGPGPDGAPPGPADE